MMYAGRAVLVVALVAVSVAALPNHLKAVVVDSDPVPVHVVKEIVPVVREKATPGYTAQAGAGGAGGLYAAADSPLGSASAGLGGSGPSVSVGSQPGSYGGHKPIHNGPGFFDSIFNIPISVLQSVNTYLNNRGPITKPVHRRRGHHPVVVQDKAATPLEQTPHSGGDAEASAASSSSASASASAETAAGSGVGGAGTHQRPVVVQKRVNYDEIFNIPIAALKSVNQLLNG